MKVSNALLLLFGFVFFFLSCKNDVKSTVDSATTEVSSTTEPINDAKALEGTGAQDVSTVYKLDQSQIVQEGNVGFNFKSQKSLDVYVNTNNNEQLNFVDNEVFAIFADRTIKETSFKVVGLDTKGEQPVLNVETVISTKTVPEYRPSFVVSVPKKDIKGVPVLKLDGAIIPTFGME